MNCAFPSHSPEDKEKLAITPAFPHVGQRKNTPKSGLHRPEDIFFFQSPDVHFKVEVQICLPALLVSLLSSPLSCFQPVMFEKVEARFIWKFLQLVIHESWKEKECE